MTEPRLTPDERLASLESQVRTLSSYLRTSSERAARNDVALLEARLAPSLLPPSDTLRGDQGRTPDLSSPLMDRLRGDAALANTAAGSILSAQGSGNLLDDPTFDTVPRSGTFTTSWQAMGPYWEGRYVLISGATPAWLAWQRDSRRDFYSSATLIVNAWWAADTQVGEVRIEVRSRPLNPADLTPWLAPQIAWPYAVGALRIQPSVLAGEHGVTTAQLKLIEHATSTELAVSDPVDLEPISGIDMELRPFVSLVSPPLHPDDLPSLQFELYASSLGTGDYPQAATAILSEPQLHYTDEESPAPYPPIGRFNPYPLIHGASYVRTTNQYVANDTWTSLAFGAGNAQRYYDTHRILTSADTSAFVAPFSGVWDCHAGVTLQLDSTGSRQLRIIHYRAAGGNRVVARVRQRPPASGEWCTAISKPVLMARGDYVRFQAWHDVSPSLYLQGSLTADETWAGITLRGFQNRAYQPGVTGPGPLWELADW